jgi:hypothetical protein
MDGQDGQDELGIKYSCQIFFPFAPSREILFILTILSIHVQISLRSSLSVHRLTAAAPSEFISPSLRHPHGDHPAV